MNNRMGRLLRYLMVLLTLSTRCTLADDEQVWDALKQGGKVVLLRHTHVDIREGIGHLAAGNCAEEVNLSASGVEQAKRIGGAFRAHGIAIGEVFSSPYCRCIDTAKLAFGRATSVQYLKPPGVVPEDQAKLNQERVAQEILKHRDPSNLVMITHDLNIANKLTPPVAPIAAAASHKERLATPTKPTTVAQKDAQPSQKRKVAHVVRKYKEVAPTNPSGFDAYGYAQEPRRFNQYPSFFFGR